MASNESILGSTDVGADNDFPVGNVGDANGAAASHWPERSGTGLCAASVDASHSWADWCACYRGYPRGKFLTDRL